MTPNQNQAVEPHPSGNRGLEDAPGSRAPIVAHGRCGARWRQSGNRTGHCSGCHHNFDGLTAFDRHQTVVDGHNICADVTTDPHYRARTDDITTYWSLIPTPAQQEYIDKMRAEREAAK